MTKILNVEVAPLNTPLVRRLQTLAVLYWMIAFTHGFGIIALITMIYLIFTKYFWIPLGYLVFITKSVH